MVDIEKGLTEDWTVLCPDCKGRGWLPGDLNLFGNILHLCHVCSRCDGEGRVAPTNEPDADAGLFTKDES